MNLLNAACPGVVLPPRLPNHPAVWTVPLRAFTGDRIKDAVSPVILLTEMNLPLNAGLGGPGFTGLGNASLPQPHPHPLAQDPLVLMAMVTDMVPTTILVPTTIRIRIPMTKTTIITAEAMVHTGAGATC